MIDTSPLLELALPQPRSLPVGQGNRILGCQGIPWREHSGNSASRRGFRITQQHKLKHLAGLEDKQRTGRQVTLGFSHTHTASQAGTQLGERRQEDSWTEWNPPA